MAQFIGAAEAAGLIGDNACVFFGGSGGGHAVAETLIEALRDRFAAQATPRGPTLVSSVSIGDWDSTGFNLLADPKLVRRVISGGVHKFPEVVVVATVEGNEAYN